MGIDWLAELERQAVCVEEVTADLDLATPVPGLDGWDVAGLLEHLGAVHRMVVGWTTTGRRSGWGTSQDADVRRWYAQGWRDLLAHLTTLGPEVRVPTWSPTDDTSGFWFRRMAHEMTIHALDAHRAAGRQDAWEVPDAVAADGVDEVLRAFLGSRQALASGTDQLVQVRVPGRWWAVSIHASVVEVGEPEPGPFADLLPDAVVRGPAPEVYRWVWGRDGDVVDSGDHAAVHLLVDTLAAATL